MSSTLIYTNRTEIDKITEELVRLIARRKKLALEIQSEKLRLGIPIADAKREKEVFENARKLSKKYGADAQIVEKILTLLVEDAKSCQGLM